MNLGESRKNACSRVSCLRLSQRSLRFRIFRGRSRKPCREPHCRCSLGSTRRLDVLEGHHFRRSKCQSLGLQHESKLSFFCVAGLHFNGACVYVTVKDSIYEKDTQGTPDHRLSSKPFGNRDILIPCTRCI